MQTHFKRVLEIQLNQIQDYQLPFLLTCRLAVLWFKIPIRKTIKTASPWMWRQGSFKEQRKKTYVTSHFLFNSLSTSLFWFHVSWKHTKWDGLGFNENTETKQRAEVKKINVAILGAELRNGTWNIPRHWNPLTFLLFSNWIWTFQTCIP